MATKKKPTKRTRKAPVPAPVAEMVAEVKDLKAEIVKVEEEVVQAAKPLLPKARAAWATVVALVAGVLTWVDASERTNVKVARGLLLGLSMMLLCVTCSFLVLSGPIGMIVLGIWALLAWANKTAFSDD